MLFSYGYVRRPPADDGASSFNDTGPRLSNRRERVRPACEARLLAVMA
jgi:hypothetical protein